MGHYRLTVIAVGGHGCQREKGDGRTVIGCDRADCPDCMGREYVRRLKRSGNQVLSADLTHWPADLPPELGTNYPKDNEVHDNLLTGERRGSF